MKYYFIDNKNSNTYTTDVLKHISKLYGHEIVPAIEADCILISLNDIMSIYDLEKARIQYRGKTIIAGGHAACHFKLLKIFADVVWVGHCFEFFKCNSLAEIKSHKSSYIKDGKIVEASQYIDWNIVPMIQQSKNSVYFWAGVGCKNKCSFCLTSWTNRHQLNTDSNIKKACILANKHKYNINIVSNEYAEDIGIKIKSHVKDMMIKDVDKLKAKDVNMIRCGIEFAAPENRKKYGKYFTDEQFIKLVNKCHELKIELNAFCLIGIDTQQQWEEFFNSLPIINSISPRIIFKFTTLEILQHTPLYKKRFELFPEILNNYFGKNILDKMHQSFSLNSMKYRTIPMASINLMLYRVALSLCVNLREFREVKQCKDYLKHDKNKMIKLVLKRFETDYTKELIVKHK